MFAGKRAWLCDQLNRVWHSNVHTGAIYKTNPCIWDVLNQYEVYIHAITWSESKLILSLLFRSMTCPSTVFVTTSHSLLKTHSCDHHRWCCTWLSPQALTTMINIILLVRTYMYVARYTWQYQPASVALFTALKSICCPPSLALWTRGKPCGRYMGRALHHQYCNVWPATYMLSSAPAINPV